MSDKVRYLCVTSETVLTILKDKRIKDTEGHFKGSDKELTLENFTTELFQLSIGKKLQTLGCLPICYGAGYKVLCEFLLSRLRFALRRSEALVKELNDKAKYVSNIIGMWVAVSKIM